MPPSSQQRRATREAAKTGPGIAVTVDGKRYVVLEADLTANEARALRQELGLSFSGLLRAAGTDFDIDLIAGVVWLARRAAGERGLSYAAVAAEITYDQEFDVDDPAAPAKTSTPGELDDHPEA